MEFHYDNNAAIAGGVKTVDNNDGGQTPAKKTHRRSRKLLTARIQTRRLGRSMSRIWGEMPAFENSLPILDLRQKMSKLFHGEVTETHKFNDNILFAIFVFLLLFFYVGLRYSCEADLREINRLQKQLLDAKYEALTRSSEVEELCKQSKVEERTRQRNLQLRESAVPPFTVK